jgi:hypothetical protein
MTREEYEILRHTHNNHREDNESLLEYLNRTWDCYGNVIGRKKPPRIKKGDVVEHITVEYNPKLRKKDKISLQGIWDGEKVKFEYCDFIVRTTHWLRLVSREYKINIFGFKFIIKRVF